MPKFLPRNFMQISCQNFMPPKFLHKTVDSKPNNDYSVVTMSFRVTISSPCGNDRDTVTATASTPTKAIEAACDALGLMDSGVFSVRSLPTGVLVVASSLPSLTASLEVLN